MAVVLGHDEPHSDGGGLFLVQKNLSELDAIGAELAISGKAPSAVYGRFRGFPLAATPIGEKSEYGVLVQIRHPLFEGERLDEEVFPWCEYLNQCAEKELIKISIDDGILWISIYPSFTKNPSNSYKELLNCVVEDLLSVGLDSADKTCHYCKIETAEELTYDEGRVGQICDDCMAERRGVQSAERRATTLGTAGALLAGVLSSFVGAAMWAGYWIVETYFIEWIWRDRDDVFIPSIITCGRAVVVGVLTGGSVGIAIRMIPNRGDKFAGGVGLACGIAATIGGELVFAAWLVARQSDYFSAEIWFNTLLSLWSSDFIGTMVRVLALLLAWVIAWDLAKPKVTPLGL